MGSRLPASEPATSLVVYILASKTVTQVGQRDAIHSSVSEWFQLITQ